MTTIEWQRNKKRWEATTPLGKISVAPHAYPNGSYGWRVSFPNGTFYRAETAEAGRAYAVDWVIRASSPSAL
jgi:hypothetical protein